MSKVHINFDNDVRDCDAQTLDDCPYGKELGSVNHFDNPADAYLEQARRYTEKHGLLSSLKKEESFSNFQSGKWYKNAVALHPNYCGCSECDFSGDSNSVDKLSSEDVDLIVEDLRKGRKIFYDYRLPRYEDSYFSEGLKRPVLEYEKYGNKLVYREYEPGDEDKDDVFAVHMDENEGRDGYDTFDKRAGWTMQKGIWKDDAIAFDPEDCGCTDCIVGNSRPLNYTYTYDDFDEFYKNVQEGRPVIYRGRGDGDVLVFDKYSKTYEFRELKDYEEIDNVEIFPIRE